MTLCSACFEMMRTDDGNGACESRASQARGVWAETAKRTLDVSMPSCPILHRRVKRMEIHQQEGPRTTTEGRGPFPPFSEVEVDEWMGARC